MKLDTISRLDSQYRAVQSIRRLLLDRYPRHHDEVDHLLNHAAPATLVYQGRMTIKEYYHDTRQQMGDAYDAAY
jgi:hypothetical protein